MDWMTMRRIFFLTLHVFLKGKHADYVIKILDGCGFFPDIGIQVLIDKSLVTIDENNKLGMHDLLQDMDKEIVQRESPEEPSGCSWLWFHEYVHHVLEENKGTNKIEGILVDLPKREVIHLSSKNFMKMKRINLFINRNALFSGEPNYLSNELRLLKWPEYPLQYLPSNFHGKRLVLNMRNNLFKGLHNGFKNLQNLAIMDFSNCEFLNKVPDLSMAPNLEELALENYSDFFMTLDCFSTLEQLDLSGSDFVSLPSCIGGFVGLRSLKLDDCKKLQDIQVLPPKMEEVYASGCISLESFSEVSKRLQFNTCELPALEWIDLSRCPKLLQNIGNDADNLLLSEGHQLGMIFPGNKIPDWFSHCKENSTSNICEMDINEPSNVLVLTTFIAENARSVVAVETGRFSLTIETTQINFSIFELRILDYIMLKIDNSFSNTCLS
ncbi:disease resistance protein RPP2A-like [Quercus suber]|uniref:disease resistance protein RPP2A-like n=1 Tax=Quercus suber TaxID=58331 RepID=UPI0032DE771F